MASRHYHVQVGVLKSMCEVDLESCAGATALCAKEGKGRARGTCATPVAT